jgi:2-methylfumaryl-CoA hydratase
MSDNKGWKGNFFEDFELDVTLPCATPRTITPGDVSAYIALTGDRTPRFCGPLGLVHPLMTFHTVLGQTVRQISLNARANLGYAGMRWLEPVRVGDTLSTAVTITGLKENSSKTSGIAWVQTTARNQNGDEVLSYTRWVMVRKRGNDATGYLEAPTVPKVEEAVLASDLVVPAGDLPSRSETGGRWAFEDYAVGERVFHYDGMMVNPSDHMSFTRLFQNTAKVHFDGLLTNGKPLVYGGVPVSQAYAQAFNGFENRLGICAINGGSHSNPLYAGDTIFSFTDVVETADLGNDSQVGALRLRLIAVKNEKPSETDGGFVIASDDPQRPGRRRYHPNVVLDLDFWEVVPKQGSIR